ncbi:magnesium chelatase ATPase subunit D, partial [Methylobacterium sp. J-072]|nr:magnesium chelatase ATPase subunit D [Methylobacterium sp. J-072]
MSGSGASGAKPALVALPLSRPSLTPGPPSPAEGAGKAEAPHNIWPDALRAAPHLATDPHGRGCAALRAGPGPGPARWPASPRAIAPPDAPRRRPPPPP